MSLSPGPWLTLDQNKGTLSFDTSAADQAPFRELLFDSSSIQPVLGEQTLRWDALVPCLTAAGRGLFHENYALGTPFDPLHVRVPQGRPPATRPTIG